MFFKKICYKESAQMSDRRKDWEYAIGMSRIDGDEPSALILELAEKEIRGEITFDEINNILIEECIKECDAKGARVQ